MYYNLRLVNKIQEWPIFIHLNTCMSNFVLNKSEPLVLINSAQIQITLPLCTSNGTHAIRCLFQHHHFPGDRRFLHMRSAFDYDAHEQYCRESANVFQMPCPLRVFWDNDYLQPRPQTCD